MEAAVQVILVLGYHFTESILCTCLVRGFLLSWVKNGDIEEFLVWTTIFAENKVVVSFLSQDVLIVLEFIEAFIVFFRVSRVSSEVSEPPCPVRLLLL